MTIARVSPGRLTRVGTLLEPTLTQDAAGQPVHAYAPSTSITPSKWRLRVRQLRGRERLAAKAIWEEADFEVTTWYVAGLTVHYRWELDDGDTLEILEVVHGERQGFTRCTCKRVT